MAYGTRSSMTASQVLSNSPPFCAESTQFLILKPIKLLVIISGWDFPVLLYLNAWIPCELIVDN